MRAAQITLPGLLLLLAAAVTACQGEDDAGPTGVAEVDAVVQAVLSGNEEALRGFVRYTAIPCTTGPLEIGGPPECLPGETDGTVVDALMVASCEGHYVRQDGLEEALTYLLAAKPNLYGVFQGSWAEIAGDYTVVFSVEAPQPGEVDGKELVIQGGDIVWINFGCGESPEQIAEHLGPPLSGTPAPTSDAGSGS